MSQFLSWAKPEGAIDATETSQLEGVISDEDISRTEGLLTEDTSRSEVATHDEDISRSEGFIAEDTSRSEGGDIIVAPHRRRSSRLIGSATYVPIKAAVMQLSDSCILCIGIFLSDLQRKRKTDLLFWYLKLRLSKGFKKLLLPPP